MTWKILWGLEVNEGDKDGEVDKGMNVTVFNKKLMVLSTD